MMFFEYAGSVTVAVAMAIVMVLEMAGMYYSVASPKFGTKDTPKDTHACDC